MAVNPLLRGAHPTQAERVDVPVGDAVLDVLIVEPEADGPWSTILLVHENQGMDRYMVDVAEGLADEGYRVVAPDLLSRVGGTAAHADDPTSTTRQIETATHVSDLVAVYDWIAAEAAPFAVVGFCFGGEVGWQLITKRSPLGAVLFYGIGPDPEATAHIHGAVYAVYAQHDPRVNDTLPELIDPLVKTDVDFILESYPGTNHAFHDHSRPERYHEEAASAVWGRTLTFLDDLMAAE